jgi:hypothetical protein
MNVIRDLLEKVIGRLELQNDMIETVLKLHSIQSADAQHIHMAILAGRSP